MSPIYEFDHPDPAISGNGYAHSFIFQAERATCAPLLGYPDAPPPRGQHLVPEVAAAMPTPVARPAHLHVQGAHGVSLRPALERGPRRADFPLLDRAGAQPQARSTRARHRIPRRPRRRTDIPRRTRDARCGHSRARRPHLLHTDEALPGLPRAARAPLLLPRPTRHTDRRAVAWASTPGLPHREPGPTRSGDSSSTASTRSSNETQTTVAHDSSGSTRSPSARGSTPRRQSDESNTAATTRSSNTTPYSPPTARSPPASHQPTGPAKPDYLAFPQPVTTYLALNAGQQPFSNPKVRQAVAAALDRVAMATVENQTPTDRLLPPAVRGAGTLHVAPPDIPNARRLAGTTHVTVRMAVQAGDDTGSRLVDVVHAALAPLGIDVQPATVTDVRAALGNRADRIQLAALTTTLDYPDPASFLTLMLGTDVPAAWLPTPTRRAVARLSHLVGSQPAIAQRSTSQPTSPSETCPSSPTAQRHSAPWSAHESAAALERSRLRARPRRALPQRTLGGR